MKQTNLIVIFQFLPRIMVEQIVKMVDNTIYYGSMILIKHNEPELNHENVQPMTLDEFEKHMKKCLEVLKI